MQRHEAIKDPELGIVRFDPPYKKVAIVGMSVWTHHLAPFGDPEWETWGLNTWGYWETLTRGRALPTRWFEMHPMFAQTDEEAAWIRTCPYPLYMPERYPDVPNCVKFPLDAVITAAGGADYFVSSFAYMMGLALLEGFQEVALYGMDFVSGREALLERPNAEFWAGLLAGRGVRLRIPGTSNLCHHPWRYGIDYHQEAAYVNHYLDCRGRERLFLFTKAMRAKAEREGHACA